MVLKRRAGWFRPILTVVVSLLCGSSIFAQKPDGYLSIDFKDSYISPKWFGPYAFPVPDQLNGEICNTFKLVLAGDYNLGHLAGNTPDLRDRTEAIYAEIRLPLWSVRVTLSAWGELYEWYQDNPKVRQLRRVDPVYPLSGSDAGNTFLSLDILALREGRFYPSLAVRVGTLFATGDDYEKARHFDCPGYFFDASAGKSFAFGKCCSLRIGATIGFACWQISPGRQLDAMMYGGKMSFNHTYATLGVEVGTYNGREADGDNPVMLKSRLDIHLGRFSPFVSWSHGFKDWPFDQFRAGLAVDFVRRAGR